MATDSHRTALCFSQVRASYRSRTAIIGDADFKNVSGEAIFHGTAVKYKVYVPIVAPLGTDYSNYISLQLSDPSDGVITNGQGLAYLVGKGKAPPVRK